MGNLSLKGSIFLSVHPVKSLLYTRNSCTCRNNIYASHVRVDHVSAIT